MDKDSAYLYLDGLQQLASEAAGDERIYTAIRPYALHAGNILSIVAYPYLLCELTRAKGVEPKYEFVVSINDWEQDQLVGPDIRKYIFDNRPLHTTIAHTIDSDGQNMVEKWQPPIEQEVNKIKVAFPEVTIRFVRNSSLHDHPLMKKTLLNTIANYKEQKELLLKVTGKPTVGEATRFANALCSNCLDANTNTEISEDSRLHTHCDKCGNDETRTYDECDFWLYHKQLFPPRLAILDFQITISGADHYLAGDFHARKALYEYIYEKPMPRLKMAFAPLLMADDGTKMSKSRKNHRYLPLEEILPHLRNNSASSLQIGE